MEGALGRIHIKGCSHTKSGIERKTTVLPYIVVGVMCFCCGRRDHMEFSKKPKPESTFFETQPAITVQCPITEAEWPVSDRG